MILNSRTASSHLTRGFLFFLLLITVAIFLLPVYWVFIKAVNGPIALFKYPPDLFPKRFSLENFRNGFQNYNSLVGFKNTLMIVAINMAGTTIVSALVAYGFARMNFPGRNVLFIIVIASILIPWDVKVIPQFMQFSYLGWTNTFLPLIVPMMFGYSFYIFVFRQFIIQIPYELDEASIIDGCSRIGVFFRILLPLLKPPIMTVLVYEFVRSWNDFLDPLIYLSKMSKYTLSLSIYYMISAFQMDWGAAMAISALAVLFPILVFFFLQKYLFGGLSFSGLKG
jgi:multiple sugar transport system permease protein